MRATCLLERSSSRTPSASFTMPGALDLIKRWQSRHPYKAVWVNHEPLT
ncbi:hypothetical protein ABZ400_15040 [Streptomyces sp. NPDC005897]